MRLTSSIAKNLRLIWRSKESAYTIIFGPILIILIVGFAFIGAGDEYAVRIGVTNIPGTYSERTVTPERAIDVLNNDGYILTQFMSQDECLQSVRDGTDHVCIVFSPTTVERDGSQEDNVTDGTLHVTLFLDLSRPNLVDKIADDLADALELESTQVRQQLATDALTRMQGAQKLLEKDAHLLQTLRNDIAADEKRLSNARTALSSLAEPNINDTDLRALSGYHLGLAGNTRTVVNASLIAFDEAEKTIIRLERDCNCSEKVLESAKETRETIDEAKHRILLISEDVTKQQLFDAQSLLSHTLDDLHTVQRELEEDMAARTAIKEQITQTSTSAKKNTAAIDEAYSDVTRALVLLRGQQASAQEITSPVQTHAVGVSVATDRLSSTYPYLLVLVIMFIGMLLASSLVVTEKRSRAAFRMFTSPIGEFHQIAASFCTALIIILAQVIVILAVSTFLLAQPLFLLRLSTILAILLAVALFTFLGMIVGALSKTQETAMIASISVGSVLLFVSNLIIPIEGMAVVVQWLTAFNPYVRLSELIRQSLFYGINVVDLSKELLIVAGICTALLLIVIYVQKRNRRAYFRQDEGLLATRPPTPLVLGTHTIRNEIELFEVLDSMTRAEFSQFITEESNPVTNWVRDELRNKSLARKLRTTNKELMILRLDKHLKNNGRKYQITR